MSGVRPSLLWLQGESRPYYGEIVNAPRHGRLRARLQTLTHRRRASVHSFRTLLRDLATVTKIRVVPRLPGAEPFKILTPAHRTAAQNLPLGRHTVTRVFPVANRQ